MRDPAHVSYITPRVLLAFCSCLARDFAHVESKTRPDVDQDGGRGDSEAYRRVHFSSIFLLSQAGGVASQKKERENLGTRVAQTSAGCQH